MKKIFSILIVLVSIVLSLSAQTFVEQKERRVYYLDVTASMKGYDGKTKRFYGERSIWENVVSNLLDAVDSIDNEDTEIIIKTFTDSAHGVQTIVSEKATKSGKAIIREKVTEIEPENNTDVWTDVYVPFEDFYEHEIKWNRVNYFFLMTDGQQTDNQKHPGGTEKLDAVIAKWNDITDNGEKHIYGFYVMLCDAARSQSIKEQIELQQHLWAVESASVNINLIRPKKDNFICNIRKGDSKRYIDIPMAGKIRNAGLKVTGNNDYCQVDRTEIIDDNTLRVYLSLKKYLAQIPNLSTLEDLQISQPTTSYTYLLSDSVSVQCDNFTPWAKIGIFTGVGLLLLLLIWFLLIKPAKYRTYRAFSKQILVKQGGKIVRQKRIKFTGARMVIFADKQVHQSVFNRIFTGKIITWVSPEFTQPITFKPTQNRKNSYMSGVGYTVTPNPIPRNGVATITNQQLNMEIILN